MILEVPHWKKFINIAGLAGLLAVWWDIVHEMVVRHVSDSHRLGFDSLQQCTLNWWSSWRQERVNSWGKGTLFWQQSRLHSTSEVHIRLCYGPKMSKKNDLWWTVIFSQPMAWGLKLAIHLSDSAIIYLLRELISACFTTHFFNGTEIVSAFLLWCEEGYM